MSNKNSSRLIFHKINVLDTYLNLKSRQEQISEIIETGYYSDSSNYHQLTIEREVISATIEAMRNSYGCYLFDQLSAEQ